MRYMNRLVIYLAAAMVAITGLSFCRPSSFAQQPHSNRVENYNPIDDIMSWKEPYFREHGSAFLGSQSPAVTLAIRDIVDRDIADEPARTQRIERALQADFVLAALFAIYCSAIFLRRRTDAIKESALDTSAAALRGFRKIKGRTKALVSEIDHRSRKN